MTGHRWRYSWDFPMESSLVVAVDDADAAVHSIRRRHDPYSGIGVPPHVTVLYPFVPPQHIDADVIRTVRETLSGVRAFAFDLTEVRSFPDAVYLAPEPPDAFVELSERLWRAFPDYPPYGGEFDTVIPHMTLGWSDTGAQEGSIGAELKDVLPIRASASALTLLVEENDGWNRAEGFVLAS